MRARAIAPTNHHDDTTCPIILRVISQTFLTACSHFIYSPSLLSLPDATKGLRVRMLRPATVSKAGLLEEACLEREREERIRHDHLRGRSRCPRVPKEAPSHRQPQSGNGHPFREETLFSQASRSIELRSPPPGLTGVPPAHLGGKQRSRRGHTGRRGTRGFLQREVSFVVQRLDRRHSAVWATLIPEFLRHRHWSMGIYLLWMVTCHFRSGEPLTILRGDIQVPTQRVSPRFQVLLYPEDRPLRSKTYAANDTVELYCPWCESLPFDSSSRPGKPHGTCIQLQLSRLLAGVEQNDRSDKSLGNFIQPLVPCMARHSGPSIDAALGTRTRKEIK